MIWTYKEGTEILRTYHKHQIDALPPSPAKVNLVTYSYMLDDDLYGSTPNPEGQQCQVVRLYFRTGTGLFLNPWIDALPAHPPSIAILFLPSSPSFPSSPSS